MFTFLFAFHQGFLMFSCTGLSCQQELMSHFVSRAFFRILPPLFSLTTLLSHSLLSQIPAIFQQHPVMSVSLHPLCLLRHWHIHITPPFLKLTRNSFQWASHSYRRTGKVREQAQKKGTQGNNLASASGVGCIRTAQMPQPVSTGSFWYAKGDLHP